VTVRVAVVDANVLYSIELTDVFITLAVHRLVRVHWSDTILDEVRRNLALRADLNAAAIDYRIDRMNLALPDARHGPAPDEMIESMPINAKDRHVLALAAHVEADCVVTFDLGDFPTVPCEPLGVEPLHPDELLDALAATEPDRTIAAVREMAARRRRPPMSTAQLLDRFGATIPKFVARCRTLL
jgi:predicted nucleic acid-binding protein